MTISVLNAKKTKWLSNMAYECASQSTCLRRRFGVVIADEFHTIISTGYNGAPAGTTDCLELGVCWREKHNIKSGEHYERCRAVHAEMNAVIQAGKSARSAILYLAGIDARTNKEIAAYPCALCARIIINAGIKYVITKNMETKNMDILYPEEINKYWDEQMERVAD